MRLFLQHGLDLGVTQSQLVWVCPRISGSKKRLPETILLHAAAVLKLGLSLTLCELLPESW